MNLNKHIDFFNPFSIESEVHIIGCGAVGSNVAHQLVRLGIINITLHDFDEVEPHNITNQTHRHIDIGTYKVSALESQLKEINPNVNIVCNYEGWSSSTQLSGYVFLCVDSIELRKDIMDVNEYNMMIKFVTDIRIGLEEAQTYAASPKNFSKLLSTMQFKDEEVTVPLSACGTQLTVLPTVQMIVSVAVMNFIRFVKEEKYNYMTVVNSLKGVSHSYEEK